MNPSLLLIPDRYKASKLYSQLPESGAGDLAFTRANDTATRVNSAGLIEKVRTNLILQSNSFDTTWVNTRSSEVSGQAGYDGTNNAWGIIGTIDNNTHLIVQPITLSAELLTFSVFAKAGAQDFCILRLDDGSLVSTAFFDLSTGTKGTIAPAFSNSEIVSVGGGWYRISVSRIAISGSNNAIIFPAASNGVTTYTGDGVTTDLFIQNAQIERGDIATPYIPTTTAAVSVGPVADIPRIDYTGGGCGKLLLEPQRTNLVLRSEEFDNAYWDKFDGTISANAAVSPDGLTSGDKFIGNAGTFTPLVTRNTTGVTAGAAYTLSVFAKKSGYNFIYLQEASVGNGRAWFNLDNGTLGTRQGDLTSSRITNYGNGWYKCEITFNQSGTQNRARFGVSNADNVTSFVNDGTSGILIWGAQLELGRYATSYIPTLGASVTRSADAASKTGISSLIGQSEGTIYVEEQYDASFANNGGVDDTLVALTDGTINNVILVLHYGVSTGSFSNRVRFFIRTSNVNQTLIDSSALTSGVYKIALAYSNNDVVAYINGVQIGTDTSANIPATSVVALVDPITINAATKTINTKSVALYTTRLTNAELAALTTL